MFSQKREFKNDVEAKAWFQKEVRKMVGISGYELMNFEKHLPKYLQILFWNMHQKSDDFAKFVLDENEYKVINEFCKKNGYITQDNKITGKGIQFLFLAERREMNKNQERFNIIVMIATIILAVNSIITLIKS